jgi:hypothetical protein
MARVTFAPAVSAARLGLASVQNPKNIYYYLFLLGPESVQNTVHALGRAGHRQRRGVQDSERVRRSAVSRPRWRGDCVGESIYCRESTWPEGCVAATAVESEWSPPMAGGRRPPLFAVVVVQGLPCHCSHERCGRWRPAEQRRGSTRRTKKRLVCGRHRVQKKTNLALVAHAREVLVDGRHSRARRDLNRVVRRPRHRRHGRRWDVGKP